MLNVSSALLSASCPFSLASKRSSEAHFSPVAIFKRSAEDEVNGLTRPPTSNIFMLLTASLYFDACVFVGHLGVPVPSLTCTIALVVCREIAGRAGRALRYFSLAAC